MSKKKTPKREESYVSLRPKVSPEMEVPKYSNHVVLKWGYESILLDFLSFFPEKIHEIDKKKDIVLL